MLTVHCVQSSTLWSLSWNCTTAKEWTNAKIKTRFINLLTCCVFKCHGDHTWHCNGHQFPSLCIYCLHNNCLNMDGIVCVRSESTDHIFLLHCHHADICVAVCGLWCVGLLIGDDISGDDAIRALWGVPGHSDGGKIYASSLKILNCTRLCENELQ